MRLKGDRRHTAAVRRLLPDAVADGRITMSASVVHICDPAPLVLLEGALDRVHPGWRADPMAFQIIFTGPHRRRPDWLLLLQLRYKACVALKIDPMLT